MPTKTISEHRKALQWRLDAGLSRRELSRLTNWSDSQIRDFEKGHKYDGTPVSQNAFFRYKMTCAAIAHKVNFNWDRLP